MRMWGGSDRSRLGRAGECGEGQTGVGEEE